MNCIRRAVGLAAVLVVLAPVAAMADRGALTLEGGGYLGIDAAAPAVGAGETATGSVGGGVVQMRYALTNRLEVVGGGYWQPTLSFAHDNVSVPATSGSQGSTGQLTSRMSSWGLSAGPRYYLRGLIWRLFAETQVGVDMRTFSSIRLVNSDGLVTYAAPDKTDSRFVVAPMLGLEWAFSDHASLSIGSRLYVRVGESVGFLVPLTFAWSWYLL